MHCNEDWASVSGVVSDVWWRTPPASSEGPQANMGPMSRLPSRLRRGQDSFICTHNRSRTHVEHADAICRARSLICHWVDLAVIRTSRLSGFWTFWHISCRWSVGNEIVFGVTARYLMTPFSLSDRFQTLEVVRDTVRLVFLFCQEFLTKCTHLESSYALRLSGLNLRILGNAEMLTAETNAMDAWQFWL